MTKHLRPKSTLRAALLCAILGAVCTAHASESLAGSADRSEPVSPSHSPARVTPADAPKENAPPTTATAAIEHQFFGPLAATGESPAATHYTALRPLWLRQESDDRDSQGQPLRVEHTFLYPIFSYTKRADGALDWSLFNLVNFSRPSPQNTHAPHAPAASAADSHGPPHTRFDLWPLYFSQQTGTPETSYRAVFPIGGQIKSRFGYDSLQWVLFPISFRSEKAGRVTHSALWPIFKKRSGDGHEGLAVWPLFGLAEKQGHYRDQYFLWPLVYHNTRYDAASGAPARRALGVLPFYAREERPGSLSETYLWPFFGYTHQAAPLAPYREQRYLWPLFVQAQGTEHTINRWAPFYSHSTRRGIEKRWFLWPIFRHETWQGQGLQHSKDQVLFFLYSSERQRSAANPALPSAHKTHLWPLFSTWDNGAGRAQTQLLSPLAVFFPNNEKIRLLYNPLFALYRRDQQAPGEVRHEVLWRAITWRRSGAARELRILGPTLGLRKDAITGKWRPFFFDFSRKKRSPSPAASGPTAQESSAPAAQASPTHNRNALLDGPATNERRAQHTASGEPPLLNTPAAPLPPPLPR